MYVLQLPALKRRLFVFNRRLPDGRRREPTLVICNRGPNGALRVPQANQKAKAGGKAKANIPASRKDYKPKSSAHCRWVPVLMMSRQEFDAFVAKLPQIKADLAAYKKKL